jgi:hypothetical protein
LRCFPSCPLIYYRDVKTSPIARLLKESGHGDIDPTFVYFTDSAYHDCDDGRSTGCYLGFFQGGLIDMSSSVPVPVPSSTAEAETSYASVTCLATVPTRRAYMAIVFDDEDRPFTVPIMTDSKATIDIARNERGTARTRHMTRRQLIVRFCTRNGYVILLHVDGKRFQLADIGTKSDIEPSEFEFKLSVIEAPSSLDAANSPIQGRASRRGVMKPESHVTRLTSDVSSVNQLTSDSGFGTSDSTTTPTHA